MQEKASKLYTFVTQKRRVILLYLCRPKSAAEQILKKNKQISLCPNEGISIKM